MFVEKNCWKVRKKFSVMMDFESKYMRVLGTIAISMVGYKIITKFLPWIYLNIIGPNYLPPKVNLLGMGSWAVVTGATDGIGKAYAKALARRGLNIVLISRSKTKLEDVAKEIRDNYIVDTKIIDVDFTNDLQIYDKIKQEIDGLEIGTLVNNVGISYTYPEFFLDVSSKNPDFLKHIISVNINSIIYMCSIIMPQMIERKKGVIINISSIAGLIPNPLLTLYSATKAFVNKFSADLQTEYRNQGIIVQCIQPGFVATNMTKIRKPTINAPSPDIFVASALKRLGYLEHTTGYLPHTLIHLGNSLLSTLFCEQFSSQIIFKHLLKIRRRVLLRQNDNEIAETLKDK